MILEPFGGIGGFSEALRMHGRTDSLLLESAPSAVRIAQLNGHAARLTNVTQFYAGGDPDGIAAGPPCQGFSMAGSGRGRGDIALILDGARLMSTSRYPYVALMQIREFMSDYRSALVLEPWRLFLETRPRWMVLEQVPAVLPLWTLLAELAGDHGYSAWAGKVRAEQFDVPQTRRRAILVVSRSRADLAPIPVRSRYHERSPERIDPGMPRWLSMADVLGRGAAERPAPTVTGGGTTAGGAEPFGNGARQALQREFNTVRWQLGDVRTGNGTIRDTGQPAPTLTASLDNGNTRWLRSNYGTGGDLAARGERSDVQPAPAVTGKAGRNKWSDGGRLTVREAACLQSFRPDFQLVGTLGEQYQAIGNAIPPMLAYHLLKGVLT